MGSVKFRFLTGAEAKKLGRRVTLRSDWEEVKLNVMKEVVIDKFTRSPELKQMLLDTEDEELVEGTTWNDTFWGINLKTGKR